MEIPEGDQKFRLSLDVTAPLKNIIEGLAKGMGASQAEVLRRAVGLFQMVKEAERRGEVPALIDQEGHVKARIVGI